MSQSTSGSQVIVLLLLETFGDFHILLLFIRIKLNFIILHFLSK